MKRVSYTVGTIMTFACFAGQIAVATSYFVDSRSGSDRNDGQSPETAWATLAKAGNAAYQVGDRILLRRGSTFRGKLAVKGVKGDEDAPVVIESYGEADELPKIDARGYIAGVSLEDCAHVEVRNIEILDNRTDQTGCSGVQMSRCRKGLIRGNRIDHPGSYVDKRMHGRGSGSWVWSCEDVLYERNQFLNARGKADSCGVHIDFNCRNVVVQRCFSMNNEGGFIEILGNNHNCAYRYNRKDMSHAE